MAKRNSPAVQATGAQIVSEGEIPSDEGSKDKFEPLAQWVMARVNSWVEWRDGEYAKKWDEWERLWRGIFSEDERLRASERSTIVTPALSEAVENAAAELEEAIFGRGQDYFDLASPEQEEPAPTPMAAAVAQTPQTPPGMPMPPGMGPGVPQMGGIVPEMGMPPGANPFLGLTAPVDPAVELDKVRARLKEDLAATDFAAETVKAILYGAVFGSGFGEIVLEDVKRRQPERAVDGQVVANTRKYTCAKLRALNPRNVAYDPNAESLESGLGIAIVEKVSRHLILQAQKDGTFRKDADLFAAPPVDTTDLSGDQQAGTRDYDEFNAKQVKYHGLVPKSLLNPKDDGSDTVQEALAEFIDADSDEFVEAFVVIVNDCNVAKAVRNPYSLQDRPIVHFPWDVVPGRILGRGICEKGAAPQKILDTEVRARLDSLALITAPMMGMDANRMPRGFKFKIKPGGSVLTNGKPSDVMEPFKFGQLDPNHWQNAADLKAMVQSATGSVDGAALAQGAGDARSGAMSMAMAPIIKRYKRTLVHFLDEFLMPALEKILWRNMQFNRDRYPTVEFKLRAASTMGIMQREYETQQMGQLLTGLQPGTPEHRAVLAGVVSNTSIPNREQVMKMIEGAEERAKAEAAAIQGAQQDPMVQQVKMVSAQLEMAKKEAEIAELRAKTAKLEAEAKEIAQSAEVNAMEVATKGLYAVPQEQQREEFDRRYKLMQLALQEAKIEEARQDRSSNERITREQMGLSVLNNQRVQKLEAALAARNDADEFEVEYNEQGRPAKLRARKKPKTEAKE